MIVRGLGDISTISVRGLGQSTANVQQMIVSAAAGYPDVPNLAAVALAVAQHESGFQANAQNPGSSAAGIFQLMASTQQTLGVSNPYDAQQNVNAGVGLLAQYYRTYGSWSAALQAFSDGPGTIGSAPSAQATDLISYVDAQTGGAVSVDSGAFSIAGIMLDPVMIGAVALGLVALWVAVA